MTMHPAQPITAYLALGSNLGDREAILRSAVESLRSVAEIEVRAVSAFIETEPVGEPDQRIYLNAALELVTTLSARDLLLQCLEIEHAHGRDRSAQTRWGPRLLDIDVLIYGDQVIDDAGPPRLKVPHPHMMERSFVLQPLAEIAPDLIHPLQGISMQTALHQMCSARV